MTYKILTNINVTLPFGQQLKVTKTGSVILKKHQVTHEAFYVPESEQFYGKESWY